jgi:dipeptidyl-peptidase 4
MEVSRMKSRLVAIAVALALGAVAAPLAQQKPAPAVPQKSTPAGPQKVKPRDLTVEQLYRVKPYQGRAAANLEFSRSGRYLAYLWNPYGIDGTDLYVVDTASGETKRVTSIDVMKQYDAPEDIERFQKKHDLKEKQDAERQAQYEAQAAYIEGKAVDLSQWEKAKIEEMKKEAAEKKAKEAAKKNEEADKRTEADKTAEAAKKNEKKDAEKEKEDWEWRDELKKKLEKDAVKPGDLYPGVSSLVWAKDGEELIFTYRGDLFRYQAAKGAIQRLTMSDRSERPLRYIAGDGGYFYSDGNGVFRASFSGAPSYQVNREIINPDDAEKTFRLGQTDLSPDGKWLAVQSYASPASGPAAPALMGSGRKVEIMTYKDRFATARKVDREMPDDKRDVPAMRLYVRPVPDGPTSYGKQPDPVFNYDGGDIWVDMTPIAWSEDGLRYTFATWEREKDLLRIYCGRAASDAKPDVVYESKGNVGHEVTDVVNPKLTPDGKTIVAVLDEDGFRQPFAIDVATKAKRALVKGEFETTTVVGFTPDSRTVFVTSNREDPAMVNIYSVAIDTGEMTPVGKPGGMHRATAVSKDGRFVASLFGNWAQRPELFLIDRQAKTEKILTDSHDQAWEAVDLIRPELFKYTNRHGDKLAGLVFKPIGWKPADRRPAVVYVYGGPLGTGHTIETDTFHGSTYLFAMYMAAKHGYVMLAVDPRGQSSYGRKFSDANWEQAGKPQVEDLEDLVKFMGTGFGVDTKKVGLHGWSFGGFQTQMTLYTSPDTFACGVAGAGPTEWENYNSWYSGRTIATSVRGKPTLRKFSLIPLARNLRKPLLLVHGMDDANVLYQDTINVWRALLESGKEALVDLFVDPEGAHGLGGAVQRKGQYKKFESFFVKNLGPVPVSK